MFHKFPKLNNIENIQPTMVDYLNRRHWIVTEKIDGCNCSIIVDDQGNVEFAGRNHLIDDSYDIYDFRKMIDTSDNIAELVNYIRNIVRTYRFETINVFGEYYGRGIQNRIDYGNDRHVRIYACLINQKHWCSFDEFSKLFKDLDRQYIVPVLGRFETFDQAVEFANSYGVNNNTVSELANQCGEGVVIYSAVDTADGVLIAYKHKCDQFKELKCLPIVRQLRVTKDKLGQQLHEVFIDYVTENRVYSVISKLGIPSDKKQYGAYVKALIEDAVEDFKHDNPDVLDDLDKDQIKKVFNVGGLGYQRLIDVLKNIQ